MLSKISWWDAIAAYFAVAAICFGYFWFFVGNRAKSRRAIVTFAIMAICWLPMMIVRIAGYSFSRSSIPARN